MYTCSLCGHLSSAAACPRCGTKAAPATGSAAPPPVPVLTAAPIARPMSMSSGIFGASLEGIVRQAHGPVTARASANGWRTATLLVAFVGLLPLMLMLLIIRVSLQIGWAMFFRSSRAAPAPSPFGGLFSQGLLGQLGRPAEPIAVYTYVIESAGQLLHVRQEGELLDGHIYAGNSVRLRGSLRGGTLLLRSGENLTLSTHLTLPGNAWRGGFFAVLLGLGLLYAGLISAANTR